MAEEDPHVRIGRLRWPVTIVTRTQVPDSGTGILEYETEVISTHADIQAVGGLTFWGAEQTDTPITHRIFMRWQDCLRNDQAIVRETKRPDDGSVRTETFHIKRIKELGGRKRYVMIEAELEKAA